MFLSKTAKTLAVTRKTKTKTRNEKHVLHSIKVGDTDISIVKDVRNLGLYLDSNLSMSTHVNL